MLTDAQKTALISQTNSNITTNGANEITGAQLNSLIKNLINGIINTLHVGATPPGDTNRLWQDTGDNSIVKYYNGSEWLPVGAGVGVTSIVVQDVTASGTYALSGHSLAEGFIILATSATNVKIGSAAGLGDYFDGSAAAETPLYIDLKLYSASSITVHFTGTFQVRFKLTDYANS